MSSNVLMWNSRKILECISAFRKCTYKGVIYWGITSIEILIEVKIKNKFPGLEGCSGFRLEPWRKTAT